ncbi:MAG: hypothetical protein ACI87A_000560, partial [Planctomycetota bacterium]
MLSLLFLTAANLFAPLLVATSQQAPGHNSSPFERGEVVEFEIPERPGARHEFFQLRGMKSVIGVAAMHVGAEVDAKRTELHLEYFPIKTSVMHVERQTAGGPRLIWRERRLRSGRTVQVDWSADGDSLSCVDWSGRDATRRNARPESGALLPLFLIERVRAGQFLSGRFDVFSPLSNQIEEWTATVNRVPWPWLGTGFARQLVLTRKDGSLAGEYFFQNDELFLFRLQLGGAVAVRTSRASFDKSFRD